MYVIWYAHSKDPPLFILTHRIISISLEFGIFLSHLIWMFRKRKFRRNAKLAGKTFDEYCTEGGAAATSASSTRKRVSENGFAKGGVLDVEMCEVKESKPSGHIHMQTDGGDTK